MISRRALWRDSRFQPALLAVVFIWMIRSADPILADPQRNWTAEWARMKPITPRGYVCYRAAQPPKIDGRLDDAAWQAVPWTEDFRDIEGDRRPKPRFRTRAKMLWDDKYFYIGAELEEPHVWGTLTQHDAVIFNDNDFEVFIDPNGDNLEYAEFEMNALNTSWDLFLPKPYKDDGRADNSWDIAGLKTAVHVNGTLNNPTDRDTGWSVEIAIPWESLANSPTARPRRTTATNGASTSPASNGSTKSSAANTNACPTRTKTIGSGRPPASSTCTARNAGATSNSPRPRRAPLGSTPTRRYPPATP